MRQRHRYHQQYCRRSLVGLAAGLAVLSGACVDSTVDPEDGRPCETKAGNSNWVDFQFQAAVTQPEVCPIGLDLPNELLPLSGDVWFPRSQPSNGGLQSAAGAHDLLVRNNAGSLNKTITMFFDQQLMDGEEVLKEHVSDSYAAGSAPGGPGADTLVFDVEVQNSNGSHDVLGRADLTYTFVPRLAVSGPATATPYEIVEISVDVENGKLPITYKWYHNDVLVKTEVVSSYYNYYSTYGLAEGMHEFNVVVTDDDGDSNNKIHMIDSAS